MGSRSNYAHREKRKNKKETKKIPSVNIVTPPVEVEVVGKGKRKGGREPEEEE